MASAGYGALIGAGITALGDRAGGNIPPFPGQGLYQPSLKRVKRYEKWGFGDIKALRQGGIEDPRLQYLGFGPNWRAASEMRLRDAMSGQAASDEARLRDSTNTYGGPSNKSGILTRNLATLRANRYDALQGAMRDLELENFNREWQNFYGMQQNYRASLGQLADLYNSAEWGKYQHALGRWEQRKAHSKLAASALNSALGTGAMSGGGGGIGVGTASGGGVGSGVTGLYGTALANTGPGG